MDSLFLFSFLPLKTTKNLAFLLFYFYILLPYKRNKHQAIRLIHYRSFRLAFQYLKLVISFDIEKRLREIESEPATLKA